MRKREARRAMLARALASGLAVRESWPSGVTIDWTFDDANGRYVTFHHDSGNENACVSHVHTAATLAEHLESRAYGFGFDLEVL